MRWTGAGILLTSLLSSVMAEQVVLGQEHDSQHTHYAAQPLAKPRRKNMDHFKLKDGPDVFSPQKMLELSRPGPAIANPAGDLAYMTVSEYSFKETKAEKKTHLLPLSVDASTITLDASGVFWLNSRTLGRVKEDDGVQTIEAFSISLEDPDSEAQNQNQNRLSAKDPVTVGTLPKGILADNFQYSQDAGILVFSALVYDDYDLTTVEEKDKAREERGTTAYVFDDTFVRHWDTWRGPKKSRLFSVSLVQSQEDQSWKLGDEFYRPLLHTDHYTPVEPFGGWEDFVMDKSHIVYTTKDPSVTESLHTRQNVYIVPIKGGKAPKELTKGTQGATHSPALSPNGDKVVWLEMARDGYESDHSSIVVYDLEKNVRFTVSKDWDRSPDNIAFSHDGTNLVFTAGDSGHIKVYLVPVPPTPSSHTEKLQDDVTPIALTEEHAANNAQSLKGGRVLFTASSFVSPNNAFLISGLNKPGIPLEVKQLTSFGSDGLENKGLDPGEEFWFTGAKDIEVHGFALKPKGWKVGKPKKYPAVFLIHGGPQGAWEDSWSTRWNPNVFAQQGYFTVFINPTGSTTYGQAFTDAITSDWGGRPFEDMQLGWKYILETNPEIDPERAVAAGASWGGFAINWIQGHPEYGFGFKALACHDGVFDTHYNGFSTDELFFFNHDFGGPPWDNKVADKFNPSRFVGKWGTPQLVIHSGKDFRLPETDGIGAFHALQQRGVASRFLYFPDENHWVLNPQNSLQWHYEVFRWFEEFVGDTGRSIQGDNNDE